ncbi:MAG: hypothetical protein AAF318_11060 [Pseudomonadota bacterium]
MRALVALLILSVPAAATAPPPATPPATPFGPMSRADIESDLFGRTIEGHYASGEAFAETLSRDLTSHYTDPDATTTGVMSFDGNALCFAYPEVGDMSGGCFRVWQRSQNCFDFYVHDDAGKPRAGFAAQLIGTDWTARVWRTDAEPSCPIAPIS